MTLNVWHAYIGKQLKTGSFGRIIVVALHAAGVNNNT